MDFSSQYKIKIKESDRVTGLISWFDCYFTHGQKDVLLSTSNFLTQVLIQLPLTGNKRYFISTKPFWLKET